MMEMISTRLTKSQKAEILEAYRSGDSTNSLADKYSCTTNTIIRTVKSLLSDSEYILLKKERSRICKKIGKIFDSKTLKLEHELDTFHIKEIDSSALNDSDTNGEGSLSQDQNNENQEVDLNNHNIDNNFEVIEPLITDFYFAEKKQTSDFKILDYESLPESVYMIVDKKVELELKLISDLPEWSFLPSNELERNAILLFTNQRSAKRSCSRNQRVIKIPNTNIFKLSKSYLISKGITRLILEDSIIAIDN